MRTCRVLCTALTLLPLHTATLPSIGLAQVDISTAVGAFLPLGEVSNVEVVRGFQANQIVVHDHTPGAVVGARLGFWLSSRFAIEVAGTYAPAPLDVGFRERGVGGATFTQSGDATTVAASGRAHFRPAGREARSAVHLIGGLGFVTRFGDGYAGVEGLTAPAAIVGAGLTVRLTDRVTLRWDLEDTISFPSPTVVTQVNQDPNQVLLEEVRTDSSTRMVNDLILVQGLSIRL